MTHSSRLRKKVISLVLAVLIAMTGITPVMSAFGADGVEGYYDIELFYKDTDTIIPTYVDDTAEEKETYIEYMVEGEELNLTYKLIDTEMPDNGYIRWYSETPTLVDVTQEGVVKAFDSSKGAVIQTWIDNEVKTIPLVGGVMATAIEKALFNEYVNVDTMDTEAIVEIVEGLFGSGSPLDKWFESYKGELIDSLRYYLDNINSNIHVQLYSADGTLLDDDYVRICVLKCEEWYANFLPNGTHITNKSQINTTVAKGSTVQLYAVTTPVRLKYGVVYSVKSSSIFEQGKVVATVDDSGLVTFKNTGTVTIMVSPDTEQIIEGILKLVNYIYALDNTGTLDTDKIADILIKYVGIDMNRTVLAAILDVCFAIKDIAGDVADPVQLTATAVEIIANLVLQFVYNDTITFNVVEAQPLTDFSIEGANTVREGSQIQLSITNIVPEVGDTSDITWSSSDPSIASVDPNTGVITGRDAGGSLGNLSNQKCTIYATSAANNVQKSYVITVTGKTGKYLSDVEIQGKQSLEMGEETDFSYTVFPKRVAESDSLYINWGIQSGVDEDGNPVYIWADSENPVTDGIGTIDANGHYTATDGGNCIIAVKATTGYYVSNGRFYEISSYIGTLDVKNGIPIDSITINVTGATGIASSVKSIQTVNVNGEDYAYATIKAGTQYAGLGAVVAAAVSPSNASNQTLRWVVDNSYYKYEDNISSDTHSVTVKQNVGHEVADTFNIYAVSEDGRVKSNTITVCVSKNEVKTNTIDQDSLEVVNGKQVEATHSISFDKSTDGTYSACYKCNWYSDDESIFTVQSKNNDNRDAVITGVDVGVATLYCVSADGGIVDTCKVTVYPDKERLRSIVNLCDRTVVKRTNENKQLYKEYMNKLDLAYYVLYDEPLASQASCDTYANELLYAFYKLGGFVGIGTLNILGAGKTPLESDYVSIKVGSTTNYTKYSYDFDYEILPANAMYSDIEWTSSNPNITVDKNGKCTPVSNDPCAAEITCTVTDYMGTQISESVYIAFARNQVTGVSLDTDQIIGGKIGETQTLVATVYPDSLVGGASCKDVSWSSSDENIATVDPNGVVTFVRGGDCTIYCTTYDGGKTAQCAVNVVTNYSNLQLLIQQYNDLSLNSINYYPDSWENFTNTMNEAQEMINRGGYSQDEVDAMYAKLEASYKALEKYNYIQKIELYLDGEATKEFYQYDLSLLKEGISYKNAVLDLNVRLYPNNGSYQSVVWESSTTNISVTSDGQCSPTINESCYGMITCTVTDHYGNVFTDSVWVSYSYYPVTELVLSEDNISGEIGKTHQLACTVKPTGTSLPPHIGAASIQDYYWESENEEIATVDQNGLVTFVSAGSTVIKAISYDGGITGECIASSEGDRSLLKKALDDYRDVDYTDYEYNYGMAFKNAYEEAEKALVDKSLTQDEIDEAAGNLLNAYSSMVSNPYIKTESITLNYTTKKRPLVGSASDVASGTVSSSDALSVNLSSGYSNYNNYNDIIINAVAYPENAMYKSINWNVDSSNAMDSAVSGSSITLTPKERNSGAWALITVKIVDHYDRETARTIYVVMSDNICTGFDITESAATIYATSQPKQLEYTVSGSPEFAGVIWTSSDENVATVDANGVVTPVDKGEAKITGKTLDGGFADTINITVLTDFSVLASKQSEYFNLIENVKDSYTYTEESLEVLSACVSEAATMINDGKATQAQVNDMIARLDDAYNSLIEYVAVNSISLTANEQDNVNVTVVKEGFIRSTNSLLNGKTVQLTPVFNNENAVYTSINWESSNTNITVDQTGLVTNNSVSAGVSKITCTVTNIFDETYSASCYVSFVRYGATGVSFAKEMVFGAPAQTVTLSPVVTNTNNSNSLTATVRACEYSSDNESIATVDENGVVTFISQGSATITATTLDGGYTATIVAYTTWDTTALKAAIDESASITYTDYAYDYGTAFKTAYDDACAVYENVYATQDEIDAACTALTEAKNALAGNEFVSPVIEISRNGETLESGNIIQVDESNTAVLDLALNEGAMIKSVNWSAAEETGVTAAVNDSNQLVITKTAEEGTLKVTVTVIDDYDREITKEYSFSVVERLVNVTSIVLTADGEQLTDGQSIVRSCGGSYTNFSGISIGYITTPEDANAISSVTYTSSAKTYVTVNSNGLVELTTAGKLRSSNTATITCTVTNSDGTQVSQTVKVTITRA